jgi:hypothetical protein
VIGERLAGPSLRIGIVLLVLTGCGGNDTSSRAEHPAAGAQDTAIAKSNLPGAKGVGAAMRMADSAAARRAREAAVSDSVP